MLCCPAISSSFKKCKWRNLLKVLLRKNRSSHYVKKIPYHTEKICRVIKSNEVRKREIRRFLVSFLSCYTILSEVCWSKKSIVAKFWRCVVGTHTYLYSTPLLFLYRVRFDKKLLLKRLSFIIDDLMKKPR